MIQKAFQFNSFYMPALNKLSQSELGMKKHLNRLFYYKRLSKTCQIKLQTQIRSRQNQLISTSLQKNISPNMTEQTEELGSVFIILTLLFLTFYSIVSSYLQHKHLPIHKSAVAIVVGIIAGFTLFIYSNTSYDEIQSKLNDEVVFSVLYPPILFAAGFNLRKKSFLKNATYVSLFGILGTFIFFIIVSLLLYWANYLNLVRDAKDPTNIRVLEIWEILLLAACFCSIDTIASQEEISSRKFPKLFSIVFGEGILKDAITIVLFRAILRLQELQTPTEFVFYWYTPLKILLNFVILVLSSTFQGVFLAFLVTYLFKKCRFLLNKQGITETCVVFLLGFAIYAISEKLSSSGVISVLVYGLTLNHYGTYNMSQKGVQVAKSTFQFASIICQGLLFLIMGIVVWQAKWTRAKNDPQQRMTHSYIFAFCVIVILIIARIINVLFVYGVGKLCLKKFDVNKWEVFILIVSGMVKGATPFALFTSVKIGSKSQYSRNQGMVLKTTIIIVIVISSIFLNSLIPKIYKKPLKQLSPGIKKQLLADQNQKKNKNKKFKTLEDKYIKPFIIYDFQNRQQEIKEIKLKKKRDSFLETLKQIGESESVNNEPTVQRLEQSLLSVNSDD